VGAIFRRVKNGAYCRKQSRRDERQRAHAPGGSRYADGCRGARRVRSRGKRQSAGADLISVTYESGDRLVALLMTRCLLFKQLLEILQIASVDVGYRPVSEVAVSPVDQVIALMFHQLLLFCIRGCRRPDK